MIFAAIESQGQRLEPSPGTSVNSQRCRLGIAVCGGSQGCRLAGFGDRALANRRNDQEPGDRRGDRGIIPAREFYTGPVRAMRQALSSSGLAHEVAVFCDYDTTAMGKLAARFARRTTLTSA